MSVREELNAYLQELEKRLRIGAALRGAAILTSVALVATVVLVLITNAFAFSRWSITSARVALLFALVFAITFGLAIPLRARTRRLAARRAEDMFPEFQQRLVTYAERDAGTREPFLELLAADTLGVARGMHPSRLVPDRNLAAFLGVGVVSLGVLIWMILAGPGFLGHGAALLWAATPRDGAAPFYDIQVTPGDVTVRRNSDQIVTAQLIGLESSNVRLVARYQSASKWDQVAMRPQAGASGFQFVFAGLPENVEYYVEAGPLRSKHYTIRVLDLPAVKNVRVTYRYPSWTHLQNVTEERGGDLRAVEGTDADLEIETDKPLTNGVLVLDDEQQIRLAPGAGNVYKGTIPMKKDGVYHVAALDQNQPVRLSNDFFIEARKAEPPNVLIARPGHDYRASPIEEVTVAVKADDEFGLTDLSLHYSVNGGPEKSVDLLKQKSAKQADGSTVLSLEDFKLVPGDVVSIYALAKDARTESRTDISFIQADPFEREFSQAQAAGGGGGGMGGQQDQNDISQREKEIIAETWKHRGDKNSTQQAAAEAAKFLSGVQSKLRNQAKSLAGRMQSRELSQENDEFGGFVKDMNAAADAMGPAADKLDHQKWQDALPDEQKALQHLLRAEATFRQIQVAFGNAGGGGGGGGAGAGRDLASLFDLELDTEKNQYETAQTAGSQSQQEKEIDEALQKLDQLARRQEELAQQQNKVQTSEQRWQQEMLRRQAEELQRQMEQMTKNSGQSGSQSSSQQGGSQSSSASGSQGQSGGKSSGGDPRVQQSLDRLRQATDDMRRATSPQQSEAEARRAADRLKEATDLLGGMRNQQTSSKVDALAEEAARLANEQREQSDRTRQMFGNGNQANPVDRRKLADERQALADDLGKLEKNMQDAARELAGNKQTAASTKMRDALSDMQGSDLRTRIQRGADWMRRGIDPNMSGAEAEIGAGMQRLEKGLRDAQAALGNEPQPGKDSQQGLETALNRVERLRNEMGALSRDGQGRPSGQQGQSQGNGSGQQGGQQGGQAGGQSGTQMGGGPGARIGGAYGGYGFGNRGGAYGDVYGNLDTGNNTPRVGSPIQPDVSGIPPQRAYDDSMRELNQLRQAVRDNPDIEKQVQELIREMERLDPSRFPGNPALVEQLHSQALADVDKLELQLRRQLDDKESGQVRSGESSSVPQGYEEPVAEYYRRLSKTSK